jgi:hypothetical protein
VLWSRTKDRIWRSRTVELCRRKCLPKRTARKEVKGQKNISKGDKKKCRRKESYSIYTYKVLKQVYPDTNYK